MDIICLGNFVVDLMAKPINGMPEMGKAAIFNRMELHTGGCANNTAIGLAKFGIKTSATGKVGKDQFGDFILNTLRKNKVDIKGIKIDKKTNTSSTFVMISSDGERSFFCYTGASANFCYSNIDFSYLKCAKHFHYGGFYLLPKLVAKSATRILKKAKNFGMTISLDTTWNARGNWENIEPCLPYLDLLFSNLEEAKMISQKSIPKEIASYFLKRGTRIVVLKMGEKGCFVKTKEKEFFVKAYKVKVIDSTGAGDAFVAGFLTGYIKGYDLRKCAKLGNAAGACCIKKIGCTTNIKNFPQILEMI